MGSHHVSWETCRESQGSQGGDQQDWGTCWAGETDWGEESEPGDDWDEETCWGEGSGWDEVTGWEDS